MARSINKVIVLGNLGADPEVRATPGGATVASFTVACSEQWKDKDGQKHEKTEWVKCIAWRGTADIAQRYLRKGSKVYVEGKLETRSWEDKNGGGKRYATEVIVSELVMLDPPSGNRGGNTQSTDGAPDFGGDFVPSGAAPADDSELPF